ncbi:MAG TPA: PhoD-like phosphatase N-terminal domain-containing protein, partial [Bryobacteraceae bacterium]|nr:PhoD-like phosphatase N-terminal domain-containing protein [Bryobacteraceae bacterium]
MLRPLINRRRFLATGGAAGLATLSSSITLPSLSRAASRPIITHGLQSGDVSTGSGVVWARVDRPSRVFFDVATSDSFRNIHQSVFVDALPESDFTAKTLIEGLPSGQDVFYRVRTQDLSDVNGTGEPMIGHFRTAPADRRDVSFVWSGDTAGQGWGIDESRGGMRIYETMLRH